MIDRKLIETAADRFDPPADAFERFTRRHGRKRRNRRIATAVLAMVVAAAAIGGLAKTFFAGPIRPASRTITSQNVGRLRLLQSVDTGASDLKGLVASDGMVFVRSSVQGGVLEAFPATCGGSGGQCRPAWTSNISGPFVAANERVFVEGDDLLMLPTNCRTDGGVCQPITFGRLPGVGTGAWPVVESGVVYVETSTNQVLGFPVDCPRAPCAPTFVSRVLPDRPASATLVNGRLIVGSGAPNRAAPGHVYVFPTRCPTPCGPERVLPPLGPAGAQIATAGNFVLVGTAIDAFHGRLIAYPAPCFLEPGCRPAWNATVAGALNAPAFVVADGQVFVASPFGADFISAYPIPCPAPCSPLWTASQVQAIAPGPPAFTGGVLLVASQTSGLRAFRADCGSGDASCHPAWSYGTGAAGSEVGVRYIVATEDRVFAATTGGRLLVFGIP